MGEKCEIRDKKEGKVEVVKNGVGKENICAKCSTIFILCLYKHKYITCTMRKGLMCLAEVKHLCTSFSEACDVHNLDVVFGDFILSL